MRLIFSTILAAALVFGGTLLFAHYFGSIEVRNDATEPSVTVRVEGEEVREDRRSLWHCPEVERIMAGPLPRAFEAGEGQRARLDSEYRWRWAELSDVYEVTDVSATGKEITCEYHKSLGPSGIAAETIASWSLHLTPELHGEVTFAVEGDNAWSYTYETHTDDTPFGCSRSVKACGFYLFQGE